jgi:hypothetical protein
MMSSRCRLSRALAERGGDNDFAVRLDPRASGLALMAVPELYKRAGMAVDTTLFVRLISGVLVVVAFISLVRVGSPALSTIESACAVPARVSHRSAHGASQQFPGPGTTHDQMDHVPAQARRAIWRLCGPATVTIRAGLHNRSPFWCPPQECTLVPQPKFLKPLPPPKQKRGAS